MSCGSEFSATRKYVPRNTVLCACRTQERLDRRHGNADEEAFVEHSLDQSQCVITCFANHFHLEPCRLATCHVVLTLLSLRIFSQRIFLCVDVVFVRAHSRCDPEAYRPTLAAFRIAAQELLAPRVCDAHAVIRIRLLMIDNLLFDSFSVSHKPVT